MNTLLTNPEERTCTLRGHQACYRLIMRVPRQSSNRCTSRRLCHEHVFVMQAGLPHRTRCRPLMIHLAPKTSTDQLPIRPATQNRPKAACAPPASPASRDSPLAARQQRRPAASTLDRLGWGKPTRRTSLGQRAAPQRSREDPRGAAIIPLALRRAHPRRCKGARARGPRAPRPRPSTDPKKERPPSRTRGPKDPQCDKSDTRLTKQLGHSVG